MFVFPLLFLIPSNQGKRCYNLGSEKNDQVNHPPILNLKVLELRYLDKKIDPLLVQYPLRECE